METKIIIWIGMIVVNAIIAADNNSERLNKIARGDKSQINHGLWFCLYLLPCIIFGIFSWKVGLSVLLLHGSVFPVLYNAFAHIPLFNLSKTTTSKYDQFLVKIGLDDMIIPNLLAFVASLMFLWI